MSAIISAIVARVIVALCSALVAGAGLSDGPGPARVARVAFVAVSSLSAPDSVAEASNPAADEQDSERTPAKPDTVRKRAGVRISISDEAIRIEGQDGTESVKLEFDSNRLGEALREAIADIDSELDALKKLPESLLVFLRDEDDRAYTKVSGGQHVVRFGKETHIRRNELVQGDIVSIGGRILIEGKVRGDVVNVLGDTELAGTAVVNGDVTTVLGRLIERDGARVRGETVTVAAGWPMPRVPFLAAGESAVKSALKLAKFIVLALLIMLVIAFLPDRMRRAADHVFGEFFKSLGVGILVILIGSLAVLIMVVILSITIIGIPIALLLALSYAAMILVGYFVGAFALGRLICRRFGICGDTAVLHGLLGIFLLSVFGLLAGLMWMNPFLLPARAMLRTLGGFLGFLAVFTGAGALVLSRAGMRGVERRPAIPAATDD